jgi:hypothetical protein
MRTQMFTYKEHDGGRDLVDSEFEDDDEEPEE